MAKLADRESLVIQVPEAEPQATKEQRDVHVNRNKLRDSLRLSWPEQILAYNGKLLPTRPKIINSDTALAAALWEIIRYYFSPQDDPTTLYPFVTPLLPEHLKSEITHIEAIAEVVLNCVDKWPPPIRWGQFWYFNLNAWPEQARMDERFVKRRRGRNR